MKMTIFDKDQMFINPDFHPHLRDASRKDISFSVKHFFLQTQLLMPDA